MDVGGRAHAEDRRRRRPPDRRRRGRRHQLIAGQRSTPCGRAAWWIPVERYPLAMPGRDVAAAGSRIPTAGIMGVSVVFAGLAYPVTGAALDLTSPALIAVVRALAGALVMLPVLRIVGSRLPSTARGWAWAALIGSANITITLFAISEGTSLAGAAVASVLLNSAPFFAALFAWLWLGEGVTALRVAGLVVGFGGIVVIVLGEPGSTGGSQVAEGTLVCLVGAIAWAAAGLGMRHLSIRDPGFDV